MASLDCAGGSVVSGAGGASSASGRRSCSSVGVGVTGVGVTSSTGVGSPRCAVGVLVSVVSVGGELVRLLPVVVVGGVVVVPPVEELDDEPVGC